MRGMLIGVALVAAACGSEPDRAARIDLALRALCGERFQAGTGCPTDRDESHAVFEKNKLTVWVYGDEASLPAKLEALTAAVAPLLDAEQRALVAEDLPMVVPERFRPYERPVNGVAIAASTWTEEPPWERVAVLSLRFDAPADAEPKPRMATLIEPGAPFSWSDALGVLDAPTLDTWKSACTGSWSSGDVWARCEAPELSYWVEWAPPSRRLLRARFEGTTDPSRAVELLVLPLLTPAQRERVAAPDGHTFQISANDF